MITPLRAFSQFIHYFLILLSLSLPPVRSYAATEFILIFLGFCFACLVIPVCAALYPLCIPLVKSVRKTAEEKPAGPLRQSSQVFSEFLPAQVGLAVSKPKEYVRFRLFSQFNIH